MVEKFPERHRWSEENGCFYTCWKKHDNPGSDYFNSDWKYFTSNV